MTSHLEAVLEMPCRFEMSGCYSYAFQPLIPKSRALQSWETY